VAGRSATVSRTTVRGPFGNSRAAAVILLEDQGTDGWGEASPLESYSPDTLNDAETDLRDWAASWVLGEDAAAPAGMAPSARCAIDTALLDLASRRRSEPLHLHLAEARPPVRPVSAVPVCALITLPGVDRPGTTPAVGDVIAEIGRRVAEGFEAVKFKVGSGPAFQDQMRVLSLVRAAYPGLEIRLDANGSWSEEDARRHLMDLADSVRPLLVEQPVGASELLTFRSTPVPIAADESLRLPDSIATLTAPDACRAVVLKPMILGGLLACASLAAEAHVRGAQAIVSHAFGGPISHAAACELAFAVAAADPTDSVIAAGLQGHEEVAQMAGPWIIQSAGPGHGVEGPS
jgi:o-succinylbenzoate synthase